MITGERIADLARRMLDSALSINDSSSSHAYSVSCGENYIDIIFNVPTSFPIDEKLNQQILKILIGGFYPTLMIYSNNGPDFVDTKSGDFSTARALRYYFKVGQYQRLSFNNLTETRMNGTKIPLMKGYDFDLFSASGMVALSGASGNGKTQLLIYMLSAVLNSMPKAVIKIIDPKLDYALYSFAKSRSLDYISPGSNSNDFLVDVQSVLSNAIDEIHRRQQKIIKTGQINEPPYIVGLDEAMAIGATMDNKTAKQYQGLITQITLMGRSARVFLWTSAQTFDANSVMSSSSRDQMAFKVVLSPNPSVNDCRYLFKDFDPTTIVIGRDGFDKGLGIASTQPDNRVVPFMAPFIRNVGGE